MMDNIHHKFFTNPCGNGCWKTHQERCFAFFILNGVTGFPRCLMRLGETCIRVISPMERPTSG